MINFTSAVRIGLRWCFYSQKMNLETYCKSLESQGVFISKKASDMFSLMVEKQPFTYIEIKKEARPYDEEILHFFNIRMLENTLGVRNAADLILELKKAVPIVEKLNQYLK